MAVNPDPARITDAIWWFWEQFKVMHPPVRLGGIYANKSGYHNTRAANQANWPGNYSIQLSLDKLGPSDKAAAIDLTFPDAQSSPPNYTSIAKYSRRLLESGRDPNDERGNYMREFYGNADLDSAVEGWDYQAVRAASSDSSHLWHIHISFMRAYVHDYRAMRAVLSILSGETVAAWRSREAGQVAEVALNQASIDAIARRIWDIDYIPSGSETNPTWQAKNTLGTALVRVTEARDDVKTLLARQTVNDVKTLLARQTVNVDIDYARLAAEIVSRLPAAPLTSADVETAVANVLSRTDFVVAD